jgi:hypothetical protein
VFCGERLLVSHLRPGKLDQAKHAWAILSLLVERLRQAWPGVRLIFRGDSGFCRHKMLSWCARKGVGYSAGLAKNPRLDGLAATDALRPVSRSAPRRGTIRHPQILPFDPFQPIES